MHQLHRLLALMLLLFAVGTHAESAATSPASHANSALTRVAELKRLSAELITRVESTDAAASQFRIDVAYYRETLRALMLADQTTAAPHIPQPTLLALVRMTALLQAAAACETGRFIVCPPELIAQLRAQQQVIDALPIAS